MELKERVVDAVAPMIRSYVGVIRNNYPNYPGRSYKRNSNGHIFEVNLSVGKPTRLPNGIEYPGPIETVIKFDGSVFSKVSVPATQFVLMNGFRHDFVRVDFCIDSIYWEDFLTNQIIYLVREANIY